MLAGGSEAPTEGHFRPVEVITREGTMFHVKQFNYFPKAKRAK